MKPTLHLIIYRPVIVTSWPQIQFSVNLFIIHPVNNKIINVFKDVEPLLLKKCL